MKVFQPCLKQVQTVVGSILPCLENERLEIITKKHTTTKSNNVLAIMKQ